MSALLLAVPIVFIAFAIRKIGWKKKKSGIVLLIVLALFLIIFGAVYIWNGLRMHQDYLANTAPWCEDHDLTAVFDTLPLSQTYPIYGCVDEKGNSLLFNYPFNRTNAEEELRLFLLEVR